MWSDKKPTESGYYWYRLDAQDYEPHIVEVSWNFLHHKTKRGAMFIHETGGYSARLEKYDEGQWQLVTDPVEKGPTP